MSRTIAKSISQWTIGRTPISIRLFRWCSRMFWTFIASRSFTFIIGWNGRLQHATMCGSSTICDASRWAKCLRMWSQFWATAIHTGMEVFGLFFCLFNSLPIFAYFAYFGFWCSSNELFNSFNHHYYCVKPFFWQAQGSKLKTWK